MLLQRTGAYLRSVVYLVFEHEEVSQSTIVGAPTV